jgi:hypothetical protein
VYNPYPLFVNTKINPNKLKQNEQSKSSTKVFKTVTNVEQRKVLKKAFEEVMKLPVSMDDQIYCLG